MDKKKKFLRTTTIILLTTILFSSCCVDNDGKAGLTVAGSTTVQPIVTKASEVYEHETGIKVGVQGGGSGTGIRMVGEGSVDIGASSRELKDAEKREHPDIKTTPIAVDCITVVVHPSNPLTGLTKEQIRGIFSGEVTNFAEVGGPDRRIVAVMREDGSGTRATFEEMVMNRENVSDANLQKPASGAIRFTVAGNQNAIGYLGIGYVDSTVKTVAVDGVEPTKENIKTEEYPLSRRLYLLTKGEASGETKRFVDFILSDEGQTIVEEEGFISIS